MLEVTESNLTLLFEGVAGDPVDVEVDTFKSAWVVKIENM